ITQSPRVVGLHAATTLTTHNQAGQHGDRRTSRSGYGAVPPMFFQAPAVALVLLPGQVRWVVVAQEHKTIFRLAMDTTRASLAGHVAARIDGPSTPGVDACIRWTTQQLPQRFTLRLVPLQVPALRSAHGAERQLNLLLPQETQQAADAAAGGELVQDQANHLPHLLVR